MNELEKIKNILKRNKTSLKKQFSIKGLGVFGSYVTGKYTAKSDVDILVEFNKTPGFFEYLRMEHLLSRLLKKRVDLVMKDALKPAIGKHILREVIYL